jgi:hypothetical protein
MKPGSTWSWPLKKHPQHAREAAEQHRCLQQAHAEVDRKIAQLQRVLVHALIRMSTHRPAGLEPERTARLQPQPHEVIDHGLAQPQLQGFAQPPLRDVQDQQRARDHREDADLHDEFVQVAARDGVVEGLVPAVELDLPVRRERDDHDDRGQQRDEPLRDRGHAQGAEQFADLAKHTGSCSRAGKLAWLRAHRCRGAWQAASAMRRAETQEMNAAWLQASCFAEVCSPLR